MSLKAMKVSQVQVATLARILAQVVSHPQVLAPHLLVSPFLMKARTK
jgi:hypothetical protein